MPLDRSTGFITKHLHHNAREVFGPGGIRINPRNKRPSAQPCDLSFCVPTCCRFEVFYHLFACEVSGEVGEDLAVAYGLKCLEVGREAIGEECFGFADEALVEHLFAALFDAGVQSFSGVMKGDDEDSGTLLTPVVMKRGKRLAGLHPYVEGAHQAAGVFGVDARGVFGVDGLQAGEQGIDSVLFELMLQ